MHEHLRTLVEERARFEVADDGRRVEGRRVDLPMDALRRLRRGRLPIDARLDLHGMAVREARVQLELFLRTMRSRGERCVLVIHGKGEHSPQGAGVLRGEIAAWLVAGRVERARRGLRDRRRARRGRRGRLRTSETLRSRDGVTELLLAVLKEHLDARPLDAQNETLAELRMADDDSTAISPRTSTIQSEPESSCTWRLPTCGKRLPKILEPLRIDSAEGTRPARG